MKTQISTCVVIAFLIFFSNGLQSQKIITNPTEKITITFNNKDVGTNGGAVTFNPKKKVYYAVIAGNSEYPLETFNEKGEFLNSKNAGIDCRGMWYNPKTKNLELNGYNETGIYSIKLDSKGFPTETPKEIFKGMIQPDPNSCGVYNPNTKEIIYYYEGDIYRYSRKNGKLIKKIPLVLPSLSPFGINNTSLFYSGVEKHEIGLLNCQKNLVYLFNIENGDHMTTIEIPKETSVECTFRFSFANNYVFFYNVEKRSWTGYKIFE